MRLIITIWTFYLMALSSLSCSDGRNKCDKSIAKIEIVQSHDHNADTDDSCSPFCYCSCCSISLNSFVFKSFEIKSPKFNFVGKKIIIRDYSLVSNYYGNIWQPPKLTI